MLNITVHLFIPVAFDTFEISRISGHSPKGTMTLSLEQLQRYMQTKSWSHIRWSPDMKGVIKRRKVMFSRSSLIVVDLDSKGTPIDLVALKDKIISHDLRGFLVNGRRSGNYTLVIVPEREMVTEEEHRATHVYWCNIFGGDRAFCDAVDYCRARKKDGNPISGTLCWDRFYSGTPAKVISYIQPLKENVNRYRPERPVRPMPIYGGKKYTYDDIIPFLSRDADRAISGHHGNRTLFLNMLHVGRILFSVGKLDELEDLVMEHYNDRCLPPFDVSMVRANCNTIKRYSKEWDAENISFYKVREMDPRRLAQSPCACGCGIIIHQQLGSQGKIRIYATPACNKRMQRKRKYDRLHGTIDTRQHNGEIRGTMDGAQANECISTEQACTGATEVHPGVGAQDAVGLAGGTIVVEHIQWFKGRANRSRSNHVIGPGHRTVSDVIKHYQEEISLQGRLEVSMLDQGRDNSDDQAIQKVHGMGGKDNHCLRCRQSGGDRVYPKGWFYHTGMGHSGHEGKCPSGLQEVFRRNHLHLQQIQGEVRGRSRATHSLILQDQAAGDALS